MRLSYLKPSLLVLTPLLYTSVNAEEKAKILHDKQPRFLEDEGFYVGTRPKISGWNVNKMENRLIKELHVTNSRVQSLFTICIQCLYIMIVIAR